MGFENIQLPSGVLSNLYKQVVVTDDYAQLSGKTERQLEGSDETVKKAQVNAIAEQQQAVASSNPVFPTSQTQTPVAQPAATAPTAAPQASTGFANNAATQSTAASGWSTAPALSTTPPDDAASYRILGKNARHISIVVYSTTDAYLPDDQLQLLTKMLDACKLNLGDVAIINQATQPIHFSQLASQLHAEKTLLFGVQPEQIGLPLSFPPYKEQEYAGCTYLLANPLGDMNQPNEEGKALKGKLWGCLKKMFNI